MNLPLFINWTRLSQIEGLIVGIFFIQIVVISILNKSENATPELFAICIQNYEDQECNDKCILMFKYRVMHNSKSVTNVVTRKHMKVIYM